MLKKIPDSLPPSAHEQTAAEMHETARNFGWGVTKVLVAMLMGASTAVLIPTIGTYTNHNTSHRTFSGHMLYQKADGVDARTLVYGGPGKKTEVWRSHPTLQCPWKEMTNYVSFADDDGDGLVDRIRTRTCDVYEKYERTIDEVTYPERFAAADQEFAEQMRRFKTLMKP